jgi:phage portal protein BeeE
MQHTYAARIVGHGKSQGGPIQPAELWPVTNSWRVSDHKTFTAVYAGANPQHRDNGRLVVFRQDFIHVKQTSHDVNVPGSGPVTITSAPTGKKVGTSAQRNGEIQFRGANGVTGTLHLSNDTVTVS